MIEKMLFARGDAQNVTSIQSRSQEQLPEIHPRPALFLSLAINACLVPLRSERRDINAASLPRCRMRAMPMKYLLQYFHASHGEMRKTGAGTARPE